MLDVAAGRAGRRRVGVVVGHVDATGVTTVRGAGRAWLPDGPEPDADTLFEIGSVTKTFTATLLACAVVSGELTLDTPVADPVPEVGPLERDGVAVTLGHLATHTAGLSRNFLPAVPGTVEMLRGRDPYAKATESRLLAGVRDGSLERTPGSGRPKYSNTGMGLLGLALARRACTSYGELVRERLARPLGLHDTATDELLTEDQRRRLALGHHRRHTPAEAWPLTGLPGAGALRSTVADQLRWLRAQASPPDGPLGEAIRLTHHEHARGIGLAWQLKKDLLWHNGGTGGFRSIVALRLDRRDGLVMLTNHAQGLDMAAFRLLARL